MPVPLQWREVPPDEVWDPLVNNDRTRGDWVESADLSATGAESYSRDEARVTLRGHFPWKKRRDARLKILGGNYADVSPPFELHRINPLPCPGEEHMRAVALDYTGYNPRAENTAEEGDPPKYEPFEPAELPTPPYPPGFIRLTCRTNYWRAEATSVFRDHPYLFAEDADFYDDSHVRLPEYLRNCNVFEQCSPTMAIVNADGAEMFRTAALQGMADAIQDVSAEDGQAEDGEGTGAAVEQGAGVRDFGAGTASG
jgi:hypothetical protein